MDYAKRLISTIEHLINTKSKKHIVGGILLSTSVFFRKFSNYRDIDKN